MSHVSIYAQKIKDIDLFCELCQFRHWEVKQGADVVVALFGANRADAVASVKLPGWRYEIAIDKEGVIRYDHFGSEAGSFDRLGEICMDYNEAVIQREIPYDAVQNVYTEDLPTGDRKMVLEYE